MQRNYSSLFSHARILVWPLLLVLLLIMSACQTVQGRFFSPDETPTPQSSFGGDPIVLPFAELDTNIAAYENQHIRIAGTFALLPPDIACTPYKGPQPQWGLVADGLRVEVAGINNLLQLAPEGAPLVIDGIWRYYEGPLGCGKEPESGSLWYLEARRVVRPNPLAFDDFELLTPGAIRTIVSDIAAGGGEGSLTDPQSTLAPNLPAPGSGTDATATPVGQSTSSPLQPTATLSGRTPTPSPTSAGVRPTATRPGGNNPTATPPGGISRGTATPTPSPTSTPTLTSGGGNATATPGSGLPTSPAGTIIPSTLEPTFTPNPYDGGDGGGGGYP